MSATPAFYTYETAPGSPTLQGMGITERQLRRAVATGKISYSKPGLRVIFSEDNLREYIERSAVKAVR